MRGATRGKGGREEEDLIFFSSLSLLLLFPNYPFRPLLLLSLLSSRHSLSVRLTSRSLSLMKDENMLEKDHKEEPQN